MAVTMDTPGRRGVGWADMNRAAKMHLGRGRHGSGVHLTHLLRCCQRNVPRFQAWRWPVADVLPLRRLLHLRLLRHAPEPEAEPVLGAPIPSRGGKSDLWPLTRAWEAHHSAEHTCWKTQATGRTNQSGPGTKNRRNPSNLPSDTFPRTTPTLPPTHRARWKPSKPVILSLLACSRRACCKKCSKGRACEFH